ncbi:MAG: regulator of sigma protease [Acidobacteriota bacterium]|jgi:regulator of sigma E protease|nr:regulator of sigma protease [Acidobacteriota bacterium]
MTDDSNTAKPKFPLSRIIIPALIALAVFFWLKGYINGGTVKNLLAFIFILGAAVVLHEFGHFIVAKMLGIRVETFSIGFGPRIWGRKWGTTEYRVSAVPLGGYVKLGGDESNAPIEGEGASDIPLEEQFTLRARWQKFLVAVAGPVMNILTALAIPFIGGLMYGVPVTPAPVVRDIRPGSAAEAAGLQKGDRIISFNGYENPKWDIIKGDGLLSPEKPLPVIVERNGQQVSLTLTPSKRVESGEVIGDMGFQPDYGDVPVVVAAVTNNSPAAEAGLQVEDRIVAIGGDPVRSSEQVTQYVQEHKAEPIRMTVERQGQQKEITASVRRLADGTERLGFKPDELTPRQHVGLMATARHAWDFNLEILRLTGKALGQLFSGERSARNTVSGPLGIYDAASNAVNEGGWGGLFSMLGFLSLSLGVFNLLPIPVLDGGAIFLLLVEAVMALGGWKLSMRVRERIQQVGFVMLLLLMGFVITNDLLKKVSRSPEETKPPAATQQK